METENLKGYRLDCLELYNWGTFHGTIEKITPACETTLLTGANGSGKTTLVDALLTLLVPRNKRFYNQSSGAEQKKERDEVSYVLGHYGKSADEEDAEIKLKMLRSKKDHSILLACFHNEMTGQFVTLAQLRWFSATELKHAYIVSPEKFSIATHFSNVDGPGLWKKNLKRDFPRTEVTDVFTKYSDLFMNYFGMRSQKALTLFNLTVGVKVLGNLNEFVRHNMLEEDNSEDEFQKLKDNFQTLMDTHRNILKAERQLEMLKPVVSNGIQFQEKEAEEKRLTLLESQIPVYFNKKELKLRLEAVGECKTQISITDEDIRRIEEEIKIFEEREKALNISIASDSATIAITVIENQINDRAKDHHRKKAKEGEFNALISNLGHKSIATEGDFHRELSLAADELKAIENKVSALENRKIEFSIFLANIQPQIKEVATEIESLQKRKTQIPARNLELRERILKAMGAKTDEIPFVGELLRVNESEKRWEGAIESLLHNFGLRLLVPTEFIHRVNQYVNQTNLKGRVVYSKVDLSGEKPFSMHTEHAPDALIEKIEIKPETQYQSWLKGQFSRHFDYLCTDNEDEFTRRQKALMPSGLHKTTDRHEKDDRPHKISPENFILGWDNREKIILLRKKLCVLELGKDKAEAEINQILSEIKTLGFRRDTLRDISRFERFEDLDWRSEEREIEKLAAQKKELVNSSSSLKQLQDQLDDVKEKKKKKDEDRIKSHALKTRTEEKIKEHNAQILELENFFIQIPLHNQNVPEDSIQPFLIEEEARDPLLSLKKSRETATQKLKVKLQDVNKTKASFQNATERLMAQYTNPKADVLANFPDWQADVMNLSPRIEYFDDFLQIANRIENENLPTYNQRFRKYMDEAVMERVTSFKNTLDDRREDIDDQIKKLNEPLRKIVFNHRTQTFIQLASRPAKDTEITSFRKRLQECIPNVADKTLNQSEEWRKQIFEKIQAMIRDLQEDHIHRKKVIDVRNWLEFTAEEFTREEGRRYNSYDSSGSLSGGEKAQFTYTILGAAIAYQFGINRDDHSSRSFRFIAVDEAFSKLDPEKSGYLMELCKQLNLQLLVVTPLDKIHIAEKYISACHFVENRERKQSHVHNMTMTEYQKMKKEFESQAQNK